jgi:uncharacterized membrane protein YcaP (DUF421 family)
MQAKPPITPFDSVRLWLGDTPAQFSVEVVLRIAILYAILIVATRLMGRRLAAGLTRNEILAVVALAAAMGPAVQDPARGLLPPLLVAGTVVLVQKAIARATVRSRHAESLLQGGTATLVVDGRMELDEMRRNGISRQRLFAMVRGQGLTHLGQLDRAYLEPDGVFTFVRHDGDRPGLSVIPVSDQELLHEQPRSSVRVCGACAAPLDTAPRCPRCRSKRVADAVH